MPPTAGAVRRGENQADLADLANGPYLLATIVELSSVKQHTLMGKVTDEYDVLYRTSIGHHEA